MVEIYFGVSTELSGSFQTWFFYKKISTHFCLHFTYWQKTSSNICSREILGINDWFKKDEKPGGKDNSPGHSLPPSSYFSVAKLQCPVWRDNPAMLKGERMTWYDMRQKTKHLQGELNGMHSPGGLTLYLLMVMQWAASVSWRRWLMSWGSLWL